MRILLTGISGYVGATVSPRLLADGHELVGLARDPSRLSARAVSPVLDSITIHTGDLVNGEGLGPALEGVDVAYFLIHSMEPSSDGAFPERERRAAQNFAAAARTAGVRRVIYFGGLMPPPGRGSRHLASRLAVEEVLRDAAPEAVALRASIVIGARSRSFRFMVRLVERIRLMVLPAWHRNRTQPLDERDMVEFLARAATSPDVAGQSLDIAGPDILTYREILEGIADAMLIARPALTVPLAATPLTSRVAAVIAGEDPELIGPLMEGLETDLLARDARAAELLDVHLHSFDSALEHALGQWEASEPLAAR